MSHSHTYGTASQPGKSMDFSKYNLKQVESSLDVIDKEEYPENYKALEGRKKEIMSEIERLDVEYKAIVGRSIRETVESNASGIRAAELFVYNGAGISIIFVLMIVSALFGAKTLSWNGGYLHGLGAIVLGLALWAFFTLVFSALSIIGMYLFKIFFGRQNM